MKVILMELNKILLEQKNKSNLKMFLRINKVYLKMFLRINKAYLKMFLMINKMNLKFKNKAIMKMIDDSIFKTYY